MSGAEIFWLCVGFTGQLVFTGRFLVQWIASERKGQSIVPVAFWYLSILGSWLLLLYAVYRRDPVIIAGQSLGVIVYSRNLMLIHQGKRANAASRTRGAPSAAPALGKAG